MIPDHYKDQFDPAWQQWLKATAVQLPEGFQPTVEQMRAGFQAMVAPINVPVDPSLETLDLAVTGTEGHSIPVRVYKHRNRNNAQPVCFFLHGGGWVLGNLDTHSGLCSDLAMQSGAMIIAIDYRLSPEHVFPAALDDSLDVIRHVHAHATEMNVDASRMAIMGDSAGASIAAAACLSLRSEPIDLCAQILAYPALGADMDRPSYTENADVPGMSEAEMTFFFMSYIGGDTLPDPLAAPLSVADVSGVPDAFITVAQFDPLRDDGIFYAEKLSAQGIDVNVYTESGLGHAYLWLRHASPAAADAMKRTCNYISDKLA